MKFSIKIALVLLTAIVAMSFTDPKPTTEKQINWVSWEEAMELQKEAPKKIFIDLYTDWCGWCKKMDKTTFKDGLIVDYMNEHFYAIKFDAEQKESIEFQGHTFNFKPGGRRGGSHELAGALLNGRMSFPSFVMMNENMERIMIAPGYKQPRELMKQLRFAAEEKYKEMTWRAYEVNLEEGE